MPASDPIQKMGCSVNRREENRAFTRILITMTFFITWMISVFARFSFVFSGSLHFLNYVIACIVLTFMFDSVGRYLELHDARIRREDPEE